MATSDYVCRYIAPTPGLRYGILGCSRDQLPAQTTILLLWVLLVLLALFRMHAVVALIRGTRDLTAC